MLRHRAQGRLPIRCRRRALFNPPKEPVQFLVHVCGPAHGEPHGPNLAGSDRPSPRVHVTTKVGVRRQQRLPGEHRQGL